MNLRIVRSLILIKMFRISKSKKKTKGDAFKLED